MVYRAMGIMSGSSLDGLDMAFIEFQEVSGKWTYKVKAAACHSYSNEWSEKLRGATSLDALQYQLLHINYGQEQLQVSWMRQVMMMTTGLI